jgi:hypothetical protein
MCLPFLWVYIEVENALKKKNWKNHPPCFFGECKCGQECECKKNHHPILRPHILDKNKHFEAFFFIIGI